MRIIYSLIVLWTLVWQVQLSHAVREGTANAKVMIQRYEQEGDFTKAALWHEAAADCLKIISIPMTEYPNSVLPGSRKKCAGRAESWRISRYKETAKIPSKGCKTHWEKSETKGTSPEPEAEREKISQFISTWVQIYPNRFYHYGIYPSFFKAEQETFKRKGDFATVLNLEADAAEMCADQYNEITVAYFRGVALNRDAIGGAAADVEGEAISRRAANHLSKVGEDCATQYEKVRDAHRQRAALLRELADGKPKMSPIEAESALRDLSRQSISPAPKLTSAQALRIANRDARLQAPLKTAHRCARIRLVSRVCVVCQLLQSRLGQSGDRACR